MATTSRYESSIITIDGQPTIPTDPCSVCNDALHTINWRGGLYCDACYWAARAPYYVKRGQMEYSMTKGGELGDLRVESQEWEIWMRDTSVIEPDPPVLVGSRRRLEHANSLCAMKNAQAGWKGMEDD